MTVHTILKHPDHRLRQKAQPVVRFDQSLTDLFFELEETMSRGPGGVGIAAPQVGKSLRLIVVDCRKSLRPCKNNGLLYMANPVIELESGEALGREGCLSVPDWVGMVPRSKKISVSYDDTEGNRMQIESSGFEARVIQHEIDHLDGILFIDRVVSTQALVRRLNNA